MDCFQKKKKEIQQLQGCPCTSAVIAWCGWRSWHGGGGLTAAHRCPFHSQAENDKFNKLKTPLRSTYGIKHTWQAAEGLLPSRSDIPSPRSISISTSGRRISFHLTSMLWHCEGRIRICVRGCGTRGRKTAWRKLNLRDDINRECPQLCVCLSPPEQTGLAWVTNCNSDGERATISLLNLEAAL